MGRISSLCAKIMSHIVPAKDVSAKGFGSNVTVRRRVEVTVERESVSVLLQGQLANTAAGAVSGGTKAEARLELPWQAQWGASRPPCSGDEKVLARRPHHGARRPASGAR